MAAKQAMKENLQCTSKYGHLRISQDICRVRKTDIEGFLTIYGHSDNLLNNNVRYFLRPTSAREKSKKVMGVVNHITYGRGGKSLCFQQAGLHKNVLVATIYRNLPNFDQSMA